MKKWEKQEKRDNKNFGGRMTIGSGNKVIKGDSQTNELLIECKCTEKNQYILKKEVLQKLQAQAFEIGKIPILSLDINNECWSMVETNFLQDILRKKG